MAEKAVAIPDDYKMCDDYPSRPWVCPIRSCRMLCKSFKGMGNHFIVRLRSLSFVFLFRSSLILTCLQLRKPTAACISTTMEMVHFPSSRPLAVAATRLWSRKTRWIPPNLPWFP